ETARSDARPHSTARWRDSVTSAVAMMPEAIEESSSGVVMASPQLQAGDPDLVPEHVPQHRAVGDEHEHHGDHQPERDPVEEPGDALAVDADVLHPRDLWRLGFGELPLREQGAEQDREVADDGEEE